MRRHRVASRALIICVVGLLTVESRGSAFVKGAQYRLGEADPGATAGGLGNDPTLDSFVDALNLTRFGGPRYSANVPAKYAASKLSMAFANVGLGGPAVPGFYGRATALSVVEQGYALELWANSAASLVDALPQPQLLAYNGDPAANGFGFYENAGNYVFRAGATERVLGPTDAGAWHHLAYVRALTSSGYYYDGKLIASNVTDPAPLAASGGFWVGGRGSIGSPADTFNGLLDEIRYQSFNPLAAGAFEPTAFLIDAPEPAGVGTIFAIASLSLVRRCRRSRSQGRH